MGAAAVGVGRSAAVPDVGELMQWPLRGRQGIALAACTVLLAAPVAAEILLPPATCLFIVPRLLLALLLPGILADVTRASADGLPGLPEWPRYPGGRTGELVRFVAVAFLALLPAGLLLGWTGCAEEAVADWNLPPACNLLLVAGLWLGALVWLPLHGVSILRASLGGVLDFPAHARIFRRHLRELAALGSLCALPLVLAVAARTVAPFPAVGGAFEVVFALYGANLGAHLAGRFLLEHRDELEEVYGG